jgi:hypothetical protein
MIAAAGLALAFGIHVLHVVFVQQVVDAEARENIRRRLVADIRVYQIISGNRREVRQAVLFGPGCRSRFSP